MDQEAAPVIPHDQDTETASFQNMEMAPMTVKNEPQDQDLGDEEDVVLSNTELGKYLTSPAVGGYFEHFEGSETRSMIIQQGPTQLRGRWDKWGTTYGFICGRQLADGDPTKNYRILSTVKAALRRFRFFLLRIWDIFQQLTPFFPWQLNARPRPREEQEANEPSKTDTKNDISYLFTTEYKLVQNSRVLAKKAVELENTVREIERISLEMSSMKTAYSGAPSANCEQRRRVGVLKILALKQFMNEQLVIADNLILIENRLVDKVYNHWLPPATIPALTKTIRAEETITLLEARMDEKENVVDPDKTVYEYDEQKDQSGAELGYESRDEVFEALVNADVKNEPDDPSASSTKPGLNEELLANQEAVMNQLKDSLLPRRADMKSRERNAYLEAYGKEPDDDVWDESSSSSSDSFVMIPTEDSGKVAAVAKYSEPIGVRMGVEESDMFGDSDSEENEDSSVKSEFLTSLEAVLKKRSGAGGSGSEFYG